MKLKLTVLKGEINNSTVVVRGFNTPVLIVYGKTRQNIRKKIEDLNNTIN